MDFSIWQTFVQGWPVITVLLAASILSIAVTIDRVLILRRARLDARGLAVAVSRVIQQKSFEAAYTYCQRFTQPAGVVLAAVLDQNGDRQAKERTLHYTLQVQVRDLEKRIPILGTIGSMAPFVGLFGTVMGVIRSFHDIAMNAGGGAEVVSAGIAEALITTALGLLVAIPAIIAYNYCVHQIHRLTGEIDIAGNELIDRLVQHNDWRSAD